jgi:hypothetical protein
VENKYSHNKKRKAPKQAVKEASAKAKKAKLNPDAHTSNRERLLAGVSSHCIHSGAWLGFSDRVLVGTGLRAGGRGRR